VPTCSRGFAPTFAIPLDDTLLYVEPIYLRAETAAYPELRLVAVMHGDNLSYAVSWGLVLSPAAGAVPGFLSTVFVAFTAGLICASVPTADWCRGMVGEFGATAAPSRRRREPDAPGALRSRLFVDDS
jgi:hypothetical protein